MAEPCHPTLCSVSGSHSAPQGAQVLATGSPSRGKRTSGSVGSASTLVSGSGPAQDLGKAPQCCCTGVGFSQPGPFEVGRSNPRIPGAQGAPRGVGAVPFLSKTVTGPFQTGCPSALGNSRLWLAGWLLWGVGPLPAQPPASAFVFFQPALPSRSGPPPCPGSLLTSSSWLFLWMPPTPRLTWTPPPFFCHLGKLCRWALGQLDGSSIPVSGASCLGTWTPSPGAPLSIQGQSLALPQGC